MFISFEGIEGTGKTTQVQAIADQLKEAGHPVVVTREPGSTDIGRQIRAILLNPAHTDIDYRAELLLYMADRAHHIHTVIKPALTSGAIVLCDRFADATTAYQGYARGISIDLIETLHSLVFGGMTPQLTILLDLPPAVGLSRAWKQINGGKRDRQETRFEHEALSFHSKVRAGYLKLAAKEPERFAVIDADAEINTVQERIFKAVKEGIEKLSADRIQKL
jgi:dTMP kinase